MGYLASCTEFLTYTSVVSRAHSTSPRFIPKNNLALGSALPQLTEFMDICLRTRFRFPRQNMKQLNVCFAGIRTTDIPAPERWHRNSTTGAFCAHYVVSLFCQVLWNGVPKTGKPSSRNVKNKSRLKRPFERGIPGIQQLSFAVLSETVMLTAPGLVVSVVLPVCNASNPYTTFYLVYICALLATTEPAFRIRPKRGKSCLS